MSLDVRKELSKAVRYFWSMRSKQSADQGKDSGHRDTGNRAAVTGGKHADGFVNLIAAIVRDAGLPEIEIHTREKAPRTLPGYFRPSKEWDIVVISGTDLVAAVEVKSQVGSFGNNFNNRVEEALGNATDFWTAYREGVFRPSGRPWLGYLFMLEEHARSSQSTKEIRLSPFSVDTAFQGLSYAKRYEKVCERLLRERLYDAACFFSSTSQGGLKGKFTEPNSELGIEQFAISLHSRAAAYAKLKR